MKKTLHSRILAVLLSLCVIIGLMVPAVAAETKVSDYNTFLASLKVLENYAANYAAMNSGKDPVKLVFNFVRTGVPKYTTGTWETMAGVEDTGFVEYVAEQDAINGTNATGLRDLDVFAVPNGAVLEFEHMFGAMDMAYHNANNTDLGSWAGDLSDLLYYSKQGGAGANVGLDAKIQDVRENYLGVDEDGVSGFGMQDIYGDLDAYYLVRTVKGGLSLSEAMEGYFTADQTDNDRAIYFLNNRFPGKLTQEDVRTAIYDSYRNNIGTQMLDAENGIVAADEELKQACCYAFADYLFELADGHLVAPEGGDDNEGGEDEGGDVVEPENPYYSVFSSTGSNLAPGVSQSINYAYTVDNKQIAYYVSTVDITRKDVSIHANYNGNDPSTGWAMSRVMDQMLAAQDRHADPASPNYIPNYNVVAGVNGDFFNMSTGKPSGALVMEGVPYHPANGRCFFAVLKDGTPVIGTGADWAAIADNVQEAVGGSEVIVRDGEICTAKSANYKNNRASRTAVGITADGQVVIMVLDGRQEPFSAGGSLEEVAQIMLDAGCVTALNLDGGGSSTFVSKAEGSDDLSVVNRPSDGFQRSVSSSLVVVSTAAVSKEFSYASISSEYDYMTVMASMEMTAIGVSASGHSAQIPANAIWQTSNEGVAIMDGNVLVPTGRGTVDVQLTVDGRVVGSKTIHVVEPDTIAFVNEVTSVIYGQPEELPVVATYNGNPVAFNAEYEVFLMCDPENAGYFEGLSFIGNEDSGLRNATVAALFFLEESELIATARVNMFRADEAVFDFDNCTGGDKTLAWDRDITNVTTDDGTVFQAVDPNGNIDITYMFGLDMEAIEIPKQLEALVPMLPGSDIEGASAWTFLLQLAQRVNPLTEVKISLSFDMDLDVDISEMTVVNEYFALEIAELDKATNTLTIIARWKEQSQAIDPATANPICILSGLKATPKEDSWDSANRVAITNTGDVTYDIYLRASALYSFACNEENQKQFNLYPFVDGDDKGGHFASTYATFEDSFTLDKTNRQGWYSNGNSLFYFVDNEPLTGIQKLPGYEDEANEYYYSFAEDGACNGAITGLFELDGKLHYAVGGTPKTGWQGIVDKSNTLNTYYFDVTTGAAVDGTQTIGGYTYIFTDYILTRGQLVYTANGPRYMWAGAWLTQAWIELDGKEAYANQAGYLLTGLVKCYYKDGNWSYMAFGDDGFWMKDYTGFYVYNGGDYYIENGIVNEYPGLLKIGEDYYYINSTQTMVKDCVYWISKTNGYMSEGMYTFDTEGKLVLSTEPDAPVEPEKLNGIVKESEEVWYYYVNGAKTYAGLIQIDGDFYYVDSSCRVKHDCTYWISKTNGKADQGLYTFDSEGKMTIPTAPEEPEEPEKLNGIVKESEDVWYYYVNGVKTYAGLIIIDGSYYYVDSSCRVKHDCTYWISKTNGYLPETFYTFDAEGKIVFETAPEEPELLNGIVKETEDIWYYYVNGVKTYAGLIIIDGDYYYVNTACQVKHDCTYWISVTNGYLPEGSYTFDSEGKIVFPEAPEVPEVPEEPEVLNGIVKESVDVWYYYVNGVKTYAGLIQIDGYYYYVDSSCRVKHDCTYWISKTNGYLPETSYTFDSEGRIVL